MTAAQGIVGEAPTAAQFKEALATKDTVVYCGHGAGQAFLNENQLKSSECKAAVLLMGCSSGRLRDGGDCPSLYGIMVLLSH